MLRRRDLVATTALAAAATAQGAIAGDPAGATRIGARIFEEGGNAFDAAVAAGIAACMLEPHAVDLGGYVACAVALDAKSGKVWAIDANSAAPRAATESMYTVRDAQASPRGINENEYGCSVDGNANVDGPRAVGVPGTLAGLGTMWSKWGRLKWPRILAPSRELVENGYAVSAGVAAAIRDRAPVIQRFPASRDHLMPDGRIRKADEKWHRPGMAATLQRLETAGWEDFYRGELGRRIAGFISENGGALTVRDMREFTVPVRPAHESQFRGGKVYSAYLANGGLSVAAALGMLDLLPKNSETDALYWHTFAEVMKLAWRDRLRYFGDPAKARVDWERLVSREHAAELVATLRANPRHIHAAAPAPPRPSPGTIHISTADSEGNLVAVTISHGGSFGSCVVVPGTGVILGHGMCRFDPRPGRPNSVGAGKRPLNNTCPTILRAPDRDAALGLRGGRRIVNVATGLVVQLMQGATPQQAVDAPRLHTEGAEPVLVSTKLGARLTAALKELGHDARSANGIGGNAGIAARNKDGSLEAGSNALVLLAAIPPAK